MNSAEEIENLCRALLSDIAPDADVTSLGADDDIRDQLDIDSVDFLNFVTAIHGATGVEIPEADYGAVGSLARLGAYIATAKGAT